MENDHDLRGTPKLVKPDSEDSEMAQPGTDWQVSKKSLRDRIAVMWNRELLADIHFIVGSDSTTQRRIPAHKFILATASPVFYAMFYGVLAGDTKEVTIPDVEPQAFLKMLRYLYSDAVILDADTVLPTLYAAKKYILPHLADICVEFLVEHVDASNACMVLDQSRIFEETVLIQRCLDIIDHWAEDALSADSFSDIDYGTLEQILSRDSLRAKETVIFTAATKWAEAECSRQGRDITPEQCREVLGDALFLIRFPVMSQSEFANGAGKSGLLSNQEVLDIFFFFSADDRPLLQFPTTARKESKLKTCCRYQFAEYGGYTCRDGQSNRIQFSVDKTIFVAGFGLYGPYTPKECEVDIELKDAVNRTVLRQKRLKISGNGSENVFHALFDCPVRIEANTYYTASCVEGFNADGDYGLYGMPDVTCDDITFRFREDGAVDNETTVSEGQIPEILFFC